MTYQIKTALSNTLPVALEQCILDLIGVESKVGTEMAQKFKETFDDMVSGTLAELLAGAIDYYIKNASITGTIITSGSPVSQMATIIPPSSPMIGGKIPNTLGIS